MTNLMYCFEIVANLCWLGVSCALLYRHRTLGRALQSQNIVNRLLAQGYDEQNKRLAALADRLAKLEADCLSTQGLCKVQAGANGDQTI